MRPSSFDFLSRLHSFLIHQLDYLLMHYLSWLGGRRSWWIKQDVRDAADKLKRPPPSSSCQCLASPICFCLRHHLSLIFFFSVWSASFHRHSSSPPFLIPATGRWRYTTANPPQKSLLFVTVLMFGLRSRSGPWWVTRKLHRHTFHSISYHIQ